MIKQFVLLTITFFSMVIIGSGMSNHGYSQQNPTQPNPCITIENNKTSVAGPSPSPSVVQPMTKEMGKGISNLTDLNKSLGSNSEILSNNSNIDSDNSTLSKGLEKSQLGNEIPGNQGTIMEGGILSNISKRC